MAVYARGYRDYDGPFSGPPGFATIFRQGFRIAWRGKMFRFIGIAYLVWFSIWTIALYVQIGLVDLVERAGRRGISTQAFSWNALRHSLSAFYGGVALLTALLAMRVGAGLVADDLRTRALPLYLVRPIRPIDYVIGKALVIPAILVPVALLPGPLFLVLVSSWQAPGESMAFFREHVEVLHLSLGHFLIASASYTGLMLFLSSRTSRRGGAIALGAVVVFGGAMIQGSLGWLVEGGLGRVVRGLGIPVNTVAALLRATAGTGRHVERDLRGLPDDGVAIAVAAVLLVLGLYTVWKRARTVEVTG